MYTVHLERLGSLNEETVRFYVAEIGSALAFLHEKKIIHRCAVSSVFIKKLVSEIFLYRNTSVISNQTIFYLMSVVTLISLT